MGTPAVFTILRRIFFIIFFFSNIPRYRQICKHGKKIIINCTNERCVHRNHRTHYLVVLLFPDKKMFLLGTALAVHSAVVLEQPQIRLVDIRRFP